MIQSYINTPVALSSNDSSVVFQKDCIRTNSCNGCRSWLCHNEGSANYDIVSGGIYKITFNATVSSAATGVVAFALFNNGEQIPGTLMVETIDAAGDYANIGINKEVSISQIINMSTILSLSRLYRPLLFIFHLFLQIF